MNVESTETDAALETVLLAVGNRDDTRVDSLVEAVTQVAAPSDATVVVTHVFDPDSYRETVERILGSSDGHIEPDELAGRLSITRAIVDELESLDTVTRATTGTRGEGIVSIAEDVDADRVIVGGRQRSPTGKAIFGSTAQEVMLNAPCPVTFVREESD